MKSLLYVSPLLSQAWNTFIKWWFLFSSGLLLLGVPWAAQFGSAVVPLGGWSIAGWLSDSLLEVSVGYLTASFTPHLRCVSCDDKGADLCTHGDFGALNSTEAISDGYEPITILPRETTVDWQLWIQVLIELLDKGVSWEPPNSPGYC